MEEGVKGVIVGFIAVVATLFSIFGCYGLIYVWIRECIDYYIRGVPAAINNKSTDATTTTTLDDEDEEPPRTLFLHPMALACPLATWLCIARLMVFENILYEVLCIAALSIIHYHTLCPFYVKSAKWLVSRCYKYNSGCLQDALAVYFIIGGLIMVRGFGVLKKSVEAHAIFAALATTIMSVIAYGWRKDRSGITNGIGLGYWYLIFFGYIHEKLWYHERELGRILVVPFIFFGYVKMIELAVDHQGTKVADLQQTEVAADHQGTNVADLQQTEVAANHQGTKVADLQQTEVAANHQGTKVADLQQTEVAANHQGSGRSAERRRQKASRAGESMH